VKDEFKVKAGLFSNADRLDELKKITGALFNRKSKPD